MLFFSGPNFLRPAWAASPRAELGWNGLAGLGWLGWAGWAGLGWVSTTYGHPESVSPPVSQTPTSIEIVVRLGEVN